ncbi:hypothetical protein GCM10023194_27910 [Planotetraspora phitsanulokensis]|uniref:Uncharacterized protein n=2 Tax=Planotetraspora phitsanulokensis TaxID=575192 RepID=A0A8J3U343_9ACTN|nr:hypothetical protein Pph01_10750 [Planotetraspora phitsanulokensis]
MHRSFPARVAMVGLIATIAIIAVFTLAVLLPAQDQAPVGTAPTSFPAQSAQAAGEEDPDEEEPEEQRHPAGTAIPLMVDQETRDQLSAAARAVVDPSGPVKGAMNVATGGTIYYGEIYGKTPKTDMHYVRATIDLVYFWKQKGDGPWEFQGGYDARMCNPRPPSIPLALHRAWGTMGEPYFDGNRWCDGQTT